MTPDLLAAVITLRAAEPCALPVHVARAAHAWLLERVERADPERAARLHQPNQPRPFTASNLWGAGRVRQNRRHLSPEETANLRFTALTAPMSAALAEALPAPGERIEFPGGALSVQETFTAADDHPWAGRATCAELLERHTLRGGRPPRGVTLKFASPTVFRSHGRDVPLPQPRLVFGGYLRRWNAFAPVALPEEALRYAEECVILSRFRIRSHLVAFAGGRKGASVGFTGRVSFRFQVGDAYWTRIMRLLAGYAFWAGTGYRTSAGLGQTQRLAR
jgi:CRISPR-associated endoribonuclease Cas6